MGLRSQERYALLTDYETTTAYARAFYTLFANMRFHREDELASPGQDPGSVRAPAHTLLVTSASVYKDRATVAANLAIVAAQSGAETILVDADLQAPSMQQRFGVCGGAGLSDLLEAGEITPERIASCLLPTFVPGLRVLGAGAAPAQGATLLLSPHLEQLVQALRELLAVRKQSAGVVLFHSAPVLSGADASLIGALTDQTVLAVIMGQTTRVQARQAQEQMAQAHIKRAGVLILHP
ncbi:MAG TPA: CpsD/CapB family tyrosine-protein kinase [Ktedonobacteraceae bacterium]